VPATLFGLPAHALVVHATVVLVPLAALLLGLGALWPRVRRALGPLPALTGVGALVLVPITTSTGRTLKARLGFDNALIERHAALANGLLPWVAGLCAAGLLMLVVDGWRPTAWATPTPVRVAAPTRAVRLILSLALLALAVVVIVEVARIGHAGAEAVWNGVGTAAPTAH
jgi:hypothetical protein